MAHHGGHGGHWFVRRLRTTADLISASSMELGPLECESLGRPQEPIGVGKRLVGVGKRSDPRPRRATEARGEQRAEVADGPLVSPRPANDEQATHLPHCGLVRVVPTHPTGERITLAVERSVGRPDVVEPIPDLADDGLSARDSQQSDVDRTRAGCTRVDCVFRQGAPSAAGRNVDQGRLTAKVLDVPRLCRSGPSFKKPNQLLADRRRCNRPLLDRRTGAQPSLELAESHLRDACPRRGIHLPHPRRDARILDGHAKARRNHRSPAPPDDYPRPGSARPADVRHNGRIITRRPYLGLTSTPRFDSAPPTEPRLTRGPAPSVAVARIAGGGGSEERSPRTRARCGRAKSAGQRSYR